ncbi:MAG: hypothetical protein OEM26_09400 [Saprospiraceae bacterium]|jgi:hypothetical protein|nr:hypothetical protein [Saprospiraceae bacterium]
MAKGSKTKLTKLEELFQQLNYKIRYEKGNFQSGFCLVEERKIAVINKFFDTEARIEALVDILQQIEVDQGSLDDKGLSTLQLALKLDPTS